MSGFVFAGECACMFVGRCVGHCLWEGRKGTADGE